MARLECTQTTAQIVGAVMASLQHHQTMAIFLILDVVPEHIEKTFELSVPKPNRTVVRMGEQIPDKLDFALIVYHTSSHHIAKAVALQQQIEDLDSRTFVYSIAVQQADKPADAPKQATSYPMWGGMVP